MLSMITVIFSSQSRMIKGPLSRMVKEVLPEHDDLNYVSVDMSFSKMIDLSNECLSLPLGYDKKAVIAENFYYLSKTREKKKLIKGDDDSPLIDFFKNPDPLIYLYLLVYSDSLDEKSSYYKALEEGGAKFVSVASFSESQWYQFIPQFFGKRGSSIEQSAVGELLNRTGGDYSLFIQEGNKLISYANGEQVTLAMVKQLVSAPLEDDIFLLSNSLMKGDRASALRVFKDIQTISSSGNGISLMNMLANQFIFLDQVRYLDRRGLEAFDIANKLKASVGRIKASLYNVKKVSSSCLHKAIEQLYSYQSQVFSGKMNDKLALELFVANFEL